MFTVRRPSPSRVRRRAALRLDTFEERTVPTAAVGVNVNSTQSDQELPLGNSGAVGPNNYVQASTNQFTAFDKTGAVLTQVPEATFWTNAGISAAIVGELLSQPRVAYDPISDRWFIAEITLAATGNHMLLARSNSGDPAMTAGNWAAVSYTATNGATAEFGNFPTLAVDKNAVYVGTGNFNFQGSGGVPTGSTLTSIPKADLTQASPTVANRTQVTQDADIFGNGVTMGWSPQAVTNFDPADNTASVVATHYVTFDLISYWEITGSGGANATFGSTTNLAIPHNALPGDARQPDGTRVLSGGDDDRYTGAAFQVGDLIYAVHPISVNSSGVGTTAGANTTDAIQLIVIRDSTNTVVTTKTFFDPAYDYTYPSVSANAFGDIVIGFNRSGGTGSTNGNLGAYAVYARINPANPGAGVTELSTVELQAGQFNAYHLSGGAVTHEVWGPYSATSSDPSDPFAFWTTAQYAQSNTAGESEWVTKVSQVLVSPRALTVSSPTANGTYGAGSTIDITISFNGPVTVTGSPQLALNSGGTATYFSGSGTSTLTFRYTVGATDSAADLDYTAAGINLNGGTINHTSGAFGVPAELTLPAPGSAGSLGANKNLVIQPSAGATGVSSTLANGTYGFGVSIPITVTFSRAVVVTGTPHLALNSGGVANYSSGSGSTTLTFTYTVGAGQSAADLDYTSTSALTLNGGTINDQGTGSPAGLTLPTPGAAGSLGANKDLVIDALPPRVTGVSSTAANGTYGFGASIPVTVTFNHAVNVTGSPQLALNSGGTAVYSSGSGSTTLTFTYTVGSGQSTADLDYTSTSALTGGTITEVGSGQTANLTLATPGAVGSLGANKDIVIDTNRAVVTNVTSPTVNGTYGTGAIIDVTVQFNRVVNVTGSPQLALNSGGTANYVSGSGSTTLTFRYTVGSGDGAADLDYASASALTGGTIQDGSGQDVNRTLPAPGSAGSLGANKALVVDTVGPTVLEFRVLFGSKKYNVIGSTRFDLPWLVTGIQVVFDEPVKTGNVRSLGGLTATRLSGLGTKTLTWNFAGIAKGSFSSTLANSGANALKDKAGNPIAAFTQAFKVLYGDVTDDGVVDTADEAAVRTSMSAPYQLLNPTGYNIFADLSGDGLVNLVDVGITRTRRGASLP